MNNQIGFSVRSRCTSITVYKHDSIVSDTALVKWKCSASYVAVAYIVVWHTWFEQHISAVLLNFH